MKMKMKTKENVNNKTPFYQFHLIEELSLPLRSNKFEFIIDNKRCLKINLKKTPLKFVKILKKPQKKIHKKILN